MRHLTTLQSDLSTAAKANWSDWKWQQRSAVRSPGELFEHFPDLSPADRSRIEAQFRTRLLQLTPYVLSLVERAEQRAAPKENDPIWRQLVPVWMDEDKAESRYDRQTENWEQREEMVTPIAQWKYDNRIIVRLANVCHAYCQFCYEALRTLEKRSSKDAFEKGHWQKTVEFLARSPQIDEVILSGGEPLMHTDETLERIMRDVMELPRRVILRIHTRALTFNPFRVTDRLIDAFGRCSVGALGLHVSHPNELTDDFFAAVRRLRGVIPIVFANMPLLRGINDDESVLRELCMKLYAGGVIPHYLYHFMPFSPGGNEYRTPVRRGVQLVRRLKRRISNLAVPEYVLPHVSGKHTLPLLDENEPPPAWVTRADGSAVVRFVNWRGQTVEYHDG